jgi:hypothetical protein
MACIWTYLSVLPEDLVCCMTYKFRKVCVPIIEDIYKLHCADICDCNWVCVGYCFTEWLTSGILSESKGACYP